MSRKNSGRFDLEKREENLNRLNAKNEKVTTLSGKQHHALQELCKMRHEMHTAKEAFFLTEDPKYAQFELYIGKDGKSGTINTMLKEAGLPTIKLDTDIFKAETDKCFKREDYSSDYAFQMAKAQAYDHSSELAEKINTQIEEYLGEIDKEHGTRYKPAGKYRYYKEGAAHAVQRTFEHEEEFKYRKHRVFVDMDGTLARFNNNISSPEELYEEGYFEKLEPQQRVVDAIKGLMKNKNIEVFILSAVLDDSKYAFDEKNEWLDKYLPEIPKKNRIFPPCGENKLEYVPGGVRATDVLLDDYTVNLNEWATQAVGIKLLNDINNEKGTWEGNKISMNRPAKEITRLLEKIVLDKEKVRDVNRQVGQSDQVKSMLSQISEYAEDKGVVNVYVGNKPYEATIDSVVTALKGAAEISDIIQVGKTDDFGRQCTTTMAISEIQVIADNRNQIIYESEEHQVERMMGVSMIDFGPDR